MKTRKTLISLLTLSSLVLAGCNEKTNTQQAVTVHVSAITAQAQKVPLTTELPGRTAAWKVAEVRPQVNGVIKSRLFEEGSEVKAGESLYLIDDSLYRAAYNKAKANMINTQRLLNRYKSLLKGHLVSQQDYDNADSSYLQAQADLETARVNLEYTRVKSPISGKIGRSFVTQGALVTANQSSIMAEVQQLDPIYVDFTQSSVDMLRLQKEIKAGDIKTDENTETQVSLTLEDGSTYEHIGKLKFSEVSVDNSTGTVTLRAIFPNPEKKLLPGMFVHVQLNEGVKDNAFIIPQAAIFHEPNGDAKCWLAVNGKAQSIVVTAEKTQGANWIITGGLHNGDIVITKGIQKLSSGVNITID